MNRAPSNASCGDACQAKPLGSRRNVEANNTGRVVTHTACTWLDQTCRKEALAVAQVRHGGFDEFAAAAWHRLVRAAYALTGDFYEAEDLVQTTLAKVYRRWRFIPRDEVNAYVRRALVNNNVNRVRKKRVTQLLMPFLPETVHNTYGGHIESVEYRATIVQALSSLPLRQRSVLVLRYLEDKSEQEVASALNCSVGTVKTHTRRALAALRNHPVFARIPVPGARRCSSSPRPERVRSAFPEAASEVTPSPSG